jgi:hypothetical protein
MQQITFHVPDELHARYRRMSKAIKANKIKVRNTVPFALVDALEVDERAGFKKIKELWKKNAAMIF